MAENLNIFKIITISDAKDLMKDDNLTLLDIRDKESFANSHIPNAINLSNDNIEEVLKELQKCYKSINRFDKPDVKRNTIVSKVEKMIDEKGITCEETIQSMYKYIVACVSMYM